MFSAKASFSQPKLADFEGNFALKRRFHDLKLQVLKEICTKTSFSQFDLGVFEGSLA